MARADMAGMFWDDTPPPKPPKKEKPKCIPPDRFWEKSDYLPGLEEAKTFAPDLFGDMELYQASVNHERLTYDIEVYPNYALLAFKSIASGKTVYFELDDNGPLWRGFELTKFRWILANFCLVTFNGIRFDIPVSAVAAAGFGSRELQIATDMIIRDGLRERDVCKAFKVKAIEVNQIDLIELTALAPGLKKCAARLHAKRLQDLPFAPGTVLSPEQILIVRRYNINDLDNTKLLHDSLIKPIELREKMGVRFGIDLRSLSDAQMAEAIISAQVKKATGQRRLPKTSLPPGTKYKYQAPSFIKYSTPLMQWVLATIQAVDFHVSEQDGSIVMPEELKQLVIEMGNCKYKLGIGGLHSREKNIAHVADEEYFIADTDATSYYPKLILNAGITPPNLGQAFLQVYLALVTERVQAKHIGDSVVAECLKIVANGTFGKLGSIWSVMYAPNLMIQVTITGQLSILMLAERFELAGIEVISINTDGIVVKCKRTMEDVFNGIVKQWGADTGFETEEIRYKAVYSRDINNYIAVYETPQKGELLKTKGAYAKTSSKKNAVAEVCIDAVKQVILSATPVEETIEKCKDIRRFTVMREVAGGAVKGYEYNLIGSDKTKGGVKSGVYLGKVVRWYYAKGEQGEIVYAKTGNRVSLSEGAKPCMDLPDEFPTDIDYDWYNREAKKILKLIGYDSADERIESLDEEEVE